MKEKFKKFVLDLDLRRQLLFITIFSLLISFISLTVILPNLLTPFYEKNIYELLDQPLSFIENESLTNNSDIAFIIKTNNKTYISSNFTNYFSTNDINLIVSSALGDRGKFTLNGQTYYYSTQDKITERVITLTDNSYIASQRRTLSLIVLPVISLTLIIVMSALAIWGNILVSKISKIKEKLENLDNNKYDHSYKFKINDEMNLLLDSAEDMRKEINSKEEYKSNMFQNISHELKTPITVINSYVEAANDKVISYEEAITTIGNEIKVLHNDVNMILQLNKLSYLKENNEDINKKVDITKLLKESVKKYKLQRRDVKWKLDIGEENIVRGTLDIWKTIIDNMFGNFVVYADSLIKVTIDDKKIMFYNDGPNVEDDLIKDIFTQYKKGIKGKFGLGLSIVKQSLELYGYKISVTNNEKGVSFIIE